MNMFLLLPLFVIRIFLNISYFNVLIVIALCVTQQCDGLIDGERVLYTEVSAAASLQTVQMSAASEGLAKVTGECADVCTLAACHSHHGTRQSQPRIVGDVYPC